MTVNMTDVENNLGKYLDLAAEYDIVIMRNGMEAARLIGIKTQNISISEKLRGIIPSDADERSIKNERMARH